MSYLHSYQPCAGDDQGSQAEDIATRRKFLIDNPDLLHKYGEDLLPLLLQVYNGTVVQQVCSCLSIRIYIKGRMTERIKILKVALLD